MEDQGYGRGVPPFFAPGSKLKKGLVLKVHPLFFFVPFFGFDPGVQIGCTPLTQP